MIMKRLSKLAFLAFLIGGAWIGWKYQDQLFGFYNEHFKKDERSYAGHVPDPERYQELKSELSEKRRKLSIRYQKAHTAREISAVHREARETLESALPKMMRCWLGTPWDFNGTATTPGSGKIACGYYVSTIMQDVGFKVRRVLANQHAARSTKPDAKRNGNPTQKAPVNPSCAIVRSDLCDHLIGKTLDLTEVTPGDRTLSHLLQSC